ncbi:MAG TPA: HAD-IIIA family hydrolase [Candidatus Paceibacterota bacterium]
MEKITKKVTQAVILAGGKGMRLMSLTADRPKPMVEIHGRPFLKYLLDLLKENGIERVLVLTGHMGERIVEHFGDGSKFGIEITYNDSPADDETGTRLVKAREKLDDEFLLLYCDNYWPLKLEKLLAFHNDHKAKGTMVVYSNKDKYSRENVRVNAEGFVELYDKSRTAEGLNGIDVGFFILKKNALDLLPAGNPSFEKEVLPQLAAKGTLTGFLTDHRYYTIGSLERFEQAVKFLKPRKIALVDRDGTINKKAPRGEYVKNWSEFKFLPGAIEGLSKLTKKGYEIYIITNQPGLARRVLTETDLSDIHTRMLAELQKRGVEISGIYYCPHNWDEGCECRKPRPGMLFQAAREHRFDLTKAVFIGDDERDGEAAVAADVPFILVSHDRGIVAAIDKLT